jgi:hypothetical protein
LESKGTHVTSLELDSPDNSLLELSSVISLELEAASLVSLLELSVFADSELSGLTASELEETFSSLELDCTPLVSLELDSSLFDSLLSGSS